MASTPQLTALTAEDRAEAEAEAKKRAPDRQLCSSADKGDEPGVRAHVRSTKFAGRDIENWRINIVFTEEQAKRNYASGSIEPADGAKVLPLGDRH